MFRRRGIRTLADTRSVPLGGTVGPICAYQTVKSNFYALSGHKASQDDTLKGCASLMRRIARPEGRIRDKGTSRSGPYRKLAWWKSAVIYEIATISFQDSDGDGKGDLAGLLSRIDYLEWLGVDAVWLTPAHPSPMRDFGYDISDFCAVDASFGTIQQFDELVEQLHGRGIRLILDFVPNHTSDQHLACPTKRRHVLS